MAIGRFERGTIAAVLAVQGCAPTHLTAWVGVPDRVVPAPQLPSASTVTRLWQDLQATAERERRSVFEVSSLLAVAAVGELPERARVLSKSAAVVLRHGGAAVSNALLEHYGESLRQMREVGYLRYGLQQIAPYTQAAVDAFDPSRETLTGKLLDRL